MCDHEGVQPIFIAPITIGGPTGNYMIECPILSCRYAEYSVVGVASSAATTFLVSGDNMPVAQLDYTGVKALGQIGNTEGVWQSGIAIVTNANNLSYAYSADAFFRITHSQKRVFVRIDTTGGQSGYITIMFRVWPLTVIPGPAPTAHPNESHLVNVARSEMTRARLAQMGIPNFALEEVR